MTRFLRWALRVAAVVAALAIAVPAGDKIYQSHQGMPLPRSTWSKAAASVTLREAAVPVRVQPLTVYIPELAVELPFHDAGQTDGWLDIGSSITSGVHFANGSTLTHGNYLVAAHVNSRDLSLSPFAKLWKIEPGTLIWVSDAAGRLHEFKAVSLNSYNKYALPKELWKATGPSTVTLVTCGGKLTVDSDGSRHYADNVVVGGVPVALGSGGS